MPKANLMLINQNAYLKIIVGKKEIDSRFYYLLQSVKVHHSRGKVTKGTIVFKDPDYEIQNSNVFNLAQRIHIYGGWQSEFYEKGPFKVSGLELEYGSDGSPMFTVELKDPTVTEMSKKHKSKSYKGKRVKDVFQEVADSYGFKARLDIEDSDNYLFGDEFTLTQSLEDDSRFLQRLADKIGYEWSMVNDTLIVERPELNKAKAIELNYRIKDRSIKVFKPNLKIQREGKKVAAKNKVIMVDPLASNADYFDQLYELGLFEEPATVITDSSIGQSANEPYANEVRRYDRADILSVDVEREKALEVQLIEIPAKDGEPYSEDFDAYMQQLQADNSINTSDITTKLQNTRDRFKEIISGNESEEAIRQAGRIDFEANPDRALLSTDKKVNVFIDPRTGRNYYSTENIVRASQGQAIPVEPDKAKKQAEAANRKVVPIECEIVPTVPSWSWFAIENVFIDGVGKKVRGYYEIHEAVLTIDKDRGVQTTLKGKKRRSGTKKGQGQGNTSDPNNPRPNQIQIQSNTKVYIDRATGVNVYAPVFSQGGK